MYNSRRFGEMQQRKDLSEKVNSLNAKLAQSELERTQEWLRSQHSKLDQDLEKTAARFIAKELSNEPIAAFEQQTKRNNGNILRGLKKNREKVERLFSEHDYNSNGVIPLSGVKRIFLDDLGLLANINQVSLFLVPFVDKKSGMVDYEEILNKLDSMDNDSAKPVKELIESRFVETVQKVGLRKFSVALKSVDNDKDGQITLRELRRALLGLDIEVNPKVLVEVFEDLDLEGEGTVEIEQLVDHCFSKTQPTESRSLLKQLNARFRGGELFKTQVEMELDPNMTGKVPAKKLFDFAKPRGISRDSFYQIVDEDLNVMCIDGYRVNYYKLAKLLDKCSDQVSRNPKATQLEKSLYDAFVHDFHKDARSMFRKYDTNHSGKISKREFISMNRKLGLSENTSRIVFKKFDEDGDAYLDFEEFIELLTTCKDKATASNNGKKTIHTLLDGFKKFDKREDGYLSKYKFLKALDELELNPSDYDVEKFSTFDGEIDYHKFVKNHSKFAYHHNSENDSSDDETNSLLSKIEDEQVKKIILQIDSWTLRRLFFSHDMDGNGRISTVQFSNVLENCKVQIPRKQINHVSKRLARILGDGNNCIVYEKLMEYLSSVSGSIKVETNNKKVDDGTLQSIHNLAKRKRLNPKILFRRMKSMDRLENGSIRFSQFYRIIDSSMNLASCCTATKMFNLLDRFLIKKQKQDGLIKYKHALNFLFANTDMGMVVEKENNVKSIDWDHIINLTKSEGFRTKHDIYRVFHSMDKSQNNLMSKINFRKCLYRIGITPNSSLESKLCNKFETRKNNSIVDYKEFVDCLFDSDEFYKSDDSDVESIFSISSSSSSNSFTRSFSRTALGKSFDFTMEKKNNKKVLLLNKIKACGVRRIDFENKVGHKKFISVELFKKLLMPIVNRSLCEFAIKKFNKGKTTIDLEEFLEFAFPKTKEKDEIELEIENNKLKEELQAFDEDFFEQLEDLKHGYTMAMERNKELEEFVWDRCAETGYAPPLDKGLHETLVGAKQPNIDKVDRALKTTIAKSLRKHQDNAMKNKNKSLGDRLKNALEQEPSLLRELTKAFRVEKLGEGEANDEEDMLYVISAKTFSRVLESKFEHLLSLKDVEDISQKFDKDGDGQVRYREFLDVIRPFVPENYQNDDQDDLSYNNYEKKTYLSDSSSDEDEQLYTRRRRRRSRSVNSRRSRKSVNSRKSINSRRSVNSRRSRSRRRSYNSDSDYSSSSSDIRKTSTTKMLGAKEILRSYIAKSADVRAGFFDLHVAFKNFDQNHDGCIDRKEFLKLLRKCGLNKILSNNEKELLLEELDPTGDGDISFDKFVRLFNSLNEDTLPPGSPQKKILEDRVKHELEVSMGFNDDEDPFAHHQFESYDKRGNGYLNRREFQKVIQDHAPIPLSGEEMDDLFEQMDKNADGKVSYSELKRFVLRGPSSPIHGKQKSKMEMETIESRLKTLIHKLSKEERGGRINLKKAFLAFDQNQNGIISKVEFKHGLKDFGFHISPVEEQRLLKRFCRGKNKNVIDFPSFVAFYESESGNNRKNVQSVNKMKKEEEKQMKNCEILENKIREKLKRLQVGPSLRRQFNRFDIGRTGDLSRKELATMLKALGFDNLKSEELDWIFLKIDSNGTNRISYAEFSAFISTSTNTKQQQQQQQQVPLLRIAKRKLIQTHANLYKTFRNFDIDDIRKLEKEEFYEALNSTGANLDPSEMEILFSSFSKNGKVYYPRFLTSFIDNDAVNRQFVKKNPMRNGTLKMSLRRFSSTTNKTCMKRDQLRLAVRQVGILIPSWQIEAAFDLCEDEENPTLIDIERFANLIQNASTEEETHKTIVIDEEAEFTGTIASLILYIRSALMNTLSEKYHVRKSWNNEEEKESQFMNDLSKLRWLGETTRSSIDQETLYKALKKDCGLKIGRADVEVLFKLMDDSGDQILQQQEITSMIFSNNTLRLALEIDEQTDLDATSRAEYVEKQLRIAVLEKSTSSSSPDPKEAFQFLDRNLTGRVSVENIKDLCVDLGYRLQNPWEIQSVMFRICRKQTDLFARICGNNDPGLRYIDVCKWIFPSSQTILDAEKLVKRAIRDSSRTGGGGVDLTRIFKRLDKKNVGYLTTTNLRKAYRLICPNLSENQLDQLVNKLNANSDGGKITLSEFVKMYS